MPLKHSTGRDSRVKHSTAADPGPVARAAPDYPRPRYSTSEGAAIGHFTGRETDYRALAKKPGDQEDKAKGAPATRRRGKRLASPRTPI